MDKASFEIVGNVGKLEFKDIKGGKKIAILSVATSERWKRDDNEWAEKTYWHRIAVFAPAKVERIEQMVQKGTRLRLVGQIRPGSYDDDKGVTRYVVEFVIGPFGDVEVLARGKAREDAETQRPKRGKAAAAGENASA
ncbi:MAG: single-stranded DNA-binding protein [Terricaulis sp.]